ncbi:Bifunctional protein GlmU [uncultured archaeon]|nr:Bifunctional protein GlmU [uncultured archaeon]
MEDPSSWPVVILCGGQGTRLREETEYKPKPMVTIGDQPILVHIMRTYAKYGHKRFILCLGYKGEQIKQYFLTREMMSNDLTIRLGDRQHDKLHRARVEEDWEITFAETGLKANTGARIKKIEKYVDTDHFLATYGDGVADIDIAKLAGFHLKQKTMGTLSGVRPPARFGLLEIEGSKITQFREKPIMDEYVNGGYYAFNKSFFGRLDERDGCVLEREPLGRLAKEGQLSIYKNDGFWHMMDTYKDFQDLNQMWDSGQAKWKV